MGSLQVAIGDESTHDADMAALLAILDEWTSSDPFDARVEALMNGTGGLPALNDTTVIDDGVDDQVSGGGDRDWVFDDGIRPQLFLY